MKMIRMIICISLLSSCIVTKKAPIEPKDLERGTTPVRPTPEPVPTPPKTGRPDVPKPPPVKVFQEPKIVVISDLNSSYGSFTYSAQVQSAVDKILNLKPDLVVITGDMVAGQKAGLNYKGMWQAFHQTVTLPLEENNIPILVTPGNHDASAYKSFENERNIYINEWREYYNRFLQGNNSFKKIDFESYPLNYSFAHSNTLFISLDASTLEKISETQKLWVVNQLKENSKYKYKVIFSHIPFVPFTQGRETQIIKDENSAFFIELKNLGANLFLSGHHHSYYPGKYLGVNVVSQDCLGTGSRKLIGTDVRSKKSFTLINFTDKEMEIDAYQYPNYENKIQRSTLPERIVWEDFTVTRDDVAF